MATFRPTCVKDVPAQDFIVAYSAHLKANDKVRLLSRVLSCSKRSLLRVWYCTSALSASVRPCPQLHLPTWVDIVKTAKHKQLPPYDEDWYFTRAGGSPNRAQRSFSGSHARSQGLQRRALE